MTRKLISLKIMILLGIAGSLILSSITFNHVEKKLSPQTASTLSLIYITSDSQISAFSSSGDGSKANPYLIQDYLVSATGNYGIEILNTTAYITINNITISNAQMASIDLQNSQNILIKNCSCSSGINVNECSSVIVQNCIVNSSILLCSSSNIIILGDILENIQSFGIEVNASSSTIIEDNVIIGQPQFLTPNPNFGIYIFQGSNTSVFANDISSFGYTIGVDSGGGIGMFGSTGNNLYLNYVHDCEGDSIALSGTSNSNNIYNNTLDDNGNGVALFSLNFIFDAYVPTILSEQYNSLYNNSIYHVAGYAITLPDMTAYSNIYDNLLFSNTGGIFDAGSYDNIYNNMMFANGGGILLSGGNCALCANNISTNGNIGVIVNSSSNHISNNNITNNAYGIIVNSSLNIITNNYFTNATIALAQDNGGNNTWSENYWGDYQTRYPNATQNNVTWSIPYQISGSAEAQDNSPLVHPPPLVCATGFLNTSLLRIDRGIYWMVSGHCHRSGYY